MYDPMDMTRVELWRNTATGAKYSATATPKVSVSRATQERTPEESGFMRRTIERNKETMAAIQLEGERFDLDERIAAELFGLSTPKPKISAGRKWTNVVKGMTMVNFPFLSPYRRNANRRKPKSIMKPIIPL